MTRRLPSVKPYQIISILEHVGFEIDHQTGSHVILWRPSDGCRKADHDSVSPMTCSLVSRSMIQMRIRVW